jgi:tRNA-Thr(GGU) m(6)t(6)A37 methyltransferase TsaA
VFHWEEVTEHGKMGPMSDIVFHPIGVIHSPFTEQRGTPIQSALAGDAAGWIEVAPPYIAALRDLAECERIWVLYHLDRTANFEPLVTPYLDTKEHGLFATRSPARPNPIGMSVLRMKAVAGTRIDVDGLDILDGTPLLDIKPYVPDFDAFSPSRAGWFDRVSKDNDKADSRFSRRP